MTQPCTASDTLAPNPQLQRSEWIDLTGEWSFAYDDDDQGRSHGWADAHHPFDQTIVVPFPPESELSGIADPGYHRTLWYSLTIQAAARDRQRLILHFGAVDYRCSVYIDGAHAADHVGGMTPFAVDITHSLTDRVENHVISLRVEDDPHDLSQPRGKQDWRLTPEGIFYNRTSGIWQPVWLEWVPQVHLTELGWTTDLVRGCVTAELELSAEPAAGTTITIGLRRPNGTTINRVTVNATARTQTVLIDLGELHERMATERLLWTPERPTLIDADIEVTHGTETDRVSSYLGLRSIEVRDGQLMLNGRPYFLRMVLEQGYWPQSHLAAPNPAALRSEVELIKELGFNAARIHQKVEDPRFLYWCDRLGLAVWGEMANAFAFSAQSRDLLLHEWPSVLRRDRSHPCILAWVPINESWGVTEIADQPAEQDFATAMYYLTKSIDPTRPAMSNEGWEHTESDIWGIHDYTPSGEGIKARYNDEALSRTLTDRGPGRRRILVGDRAKRGQAVMITEFGGISYAPEVGQRWFGYSTVTSETEYLDRFEDLITAITQQPALVGFCYTQLTDAMQENNGLLHADRTPKLPVERIRAIVTTPAKAIPAEEVDRYRRAIEDRRLHSPAGP